MGSHSATKSHPQGPIPTAAPRASKWAPQNALTVNGLTRRRFFPVLLAVALGGLWGSLDRVFGAGDQAADVAAMAPDQQQAHQPDDEGERA